MNEGFKCRCGGLVMVGTASDLKYGSDTPISKELKKQLQDDPNLPVVLHKTPHCVQFERMEPLDFLRWVRTGKPVMN